MANPPITIGPFDNVPAPGSPIRSDWAQEISNYVNNLPNALMTFVSTVANSNGHGAAPADITGSGFGVTARGSRSYLLLVSFGTILQQSATGHVGLIVATTAGTVVRQLTYTQTVNQYAQPTLICSLPAVGGANAFKLRAQTSAGTLDISAGTQIIVIDVGPNPIVPPG